MLVQCKSKFSQKFASLSCSFSLDYKSNYSNSEVFNMDMEDAAGDVVRSEKIADSFQVDKLPEPALHHLFKYLDWNEQKCMLQLCKGMERYIHHEYGIHASVNASHCNLPLWFRLNPKSQYSTVKLIPDSIITQKVQDWEGKVIRTLEINEMHPDYIPIPFQKLIQYPWKLLGVSLRYVDAGFLLELLASCRNILEFGYEGGLLRRSIEGIQPVPIIIYQEQIIQIVTHFPQSNLQMEKLSSLSLRLGEFDPELYSDWANVILVLLTLSQRTLGSLKTFKFQFFCLEDYLNLKDHLQTLACIGQFLARCPNLRELDHWSFAKKSGVQPDNLDWERDLFEITRGPFLPKSVLTCLIKKYGSALLKEVHVAGSLGFHERMLQAIREIMGEAGASMKKLETVRIAWHRRHEPELFQHLLSSLPSPSIRNIVILDQTGHSFAGGSYGLLLGQIQPQLIQPLYWNQNLEELVVSRVEETIDNVIAEEVGNRPFSLPRLLSQMPSLAEIRIVLREPHTGAIELSGLEKHEPDYRLYDDEERDDFEIPDVDFEEIVDVHFQALRVLELRGVKMSTEATARLIQLRNLEELELIVLPEYRHQLFGINSGDLLRLMGTLRKLRKLEVTMILFPDDEVLKSAQVEVLRGIGDLTQMRRGIASYTPLFQQYMFLDTEPMLQYKFAFDD